MADSSTDARPLIAAPRDRAARSLWPRLYNALWRPALPFALVANARGGRDRNERMGRVKVLDGAGDPGAPRIWIHAASVGEIEAVRPIAAGLAREMPDAMLAITTMTAAGRDAASRRITSPRVCQLAPFDHPAAVRSFLAGFHPHLLAIAETELWPNFFIESRRAGTKIAIVNGRLSRRSVGRYQFVRPLIARALACAELILAQSEDDARRFSELGAPPDRVHVTGNTKLDLTDAPPIRPALARFAHGRPILMAGSTAPGEERMALNVYRNLVERFPQLALVIAPRHLERAAEVEAELRSAGVPYVRARALPSLDLAGSVPEIKENVLLLDTMGELRGMYSRAAIAFVGGSMTPGRGGQSMAEPAVAGAPVIFGPYHENQRVVADALVAAGAARVVNDSAELETVCAEWLSDQTARAAAGDRARDEIRRLGGGSAATLRWLRELLAKD